MQKKLDHRISQETITRLPSKTLLRVHEVAKIFEVSNKTIYNWVMTGKLLAINPSGGCLRIFTNSVANLIEGNITLKK